MQEDSGERGWKDRLRSSWDLYILKSIECIMVSRTRPGKIRQARRGGNRRRKEGEKYDE